LPATLGTTSTSAAPANVGRSAQAGEAPAPQPSLLPPPTPVPPETPRPTTAPVATEPTLGFTEVVVGPEWPGRFWTSVEYLIWKTEHGPLNYPIETGGFVGTSGVVGSSSTSTGIYFGRNDMVYPNYNGVRVTTGLWIDHAEHFGVEASAFLLDSPGIHLKSNVSAVVVNGTVGPFPPVSIFETFINATTGAQSAMLLAAQGTSSGFLNVDSSSFLWGAEVNLIGNLYRGPCCRFDLLAGYRNLNLSENLNITSDTNASGAGTYVISDHFGTRNMFNGGQIGARAEWRHEAFRVGLTGKLAVGDTQETLTVAGTTNLFGAAGGVTFPAGFYALPSNSGHFVLDQFSAVPQVNVNLGYQAGSHCYFFLGYDFLFWTRVLRPGAQVNPVLDPTQIPANSAFVPGATPGNPVPLFIPHDFWAMGVDLGVEVRY
jgi:hypothetical protein